MRLKEKYQEFDPLEPEAFAALEKDILENGVLVEIVFDEAGNVLDGHHRMEICQKHDITDYPSKIVSGLSEDEKRDYAQSVNSIRRHLTREQKRKQVRNRLKRHPDHSDRRIAQALGVDHKTVAAVRKEMVGGGEIPHVERKVGSNGMSYIPPQRRMTDSGGGEIPQHLEKVFAKIPEFRSLVNTLTDAKRRIIDLGNRFPGIHSKSGIVRQHVDSLIEMLIANSPCAMHSDCGGEGCPDCKNLGYTGGEIPQQD